MSCLSLPRGGTVHPGIRWTLVGINILLIITGISMVLLGMQTLIDTHVGNTSNRPKLWWMGIMLIVWTLFSVLTGAGSYVFFIKSGCFNPERFGVTMQIYGTCHQEGEYCKCTWSSEPFLLSRQHSCAQIRSSTSIYLSQMILMTLSLAATIIGCFLAAVVTCCARCLGLQTAEELALLKSGMIPLNIKHNKQKPRTYKTDYVPPQSTRTYVTDQPHTSTTML